MCYSIIANTNTDGSIHILPKYEYEALAAEKMLEQQQSLIGSKLDSRQISFGPLHREFKAPELPNIFKQFLPA